MRTHLGHCADCDNAIYDHCDLVILTNPKDKTFIEHYHKWCFDDKVKFNGFGTTFSQSSAVERSEHNRNH